MPYPKEHACRLLDPKTEHDRVRRSSKKFGDKTADVIWYVKDNKSQMQSVRFPTSRWDEDEARDMCKELEGTFEAAEESSSNVARPQVQMYLADLNRHEVTYENLGDGKYLVRGLPIMRVGEWNGFDYTAETLREIAANFALLQEADDFEPALLPRHKFDAEGASLRLPAEEIHGYFSALYFNDQTETLLGDIPILDEQVLADMQRGKLRYISSEFVSDYESPGLGVNLGIVLVGAAWVADPAVKGMPWDLVMNSAEYAGLRPTTLELGPHSLSDLQGLLAEQASALPQYQDPEEQYTGPWVREVYDAYCIIEFSAHNYQHDYTVTEQGNVELSQTGQPVKLTWAALQQAKSKLRQTGGGSIMALVDRVKGVFKVLAGEGKAEDLAALMEEGDGEPQDGAEVVALQQQLKTVEDDLAARKEAETKAAASAAEAGAKSQVAQLLADKFIMPAQQDVLVAVLVDLGSRSRTVTLEGGATQEQNLGEGLVECLRQREQIAESYFRQLSDNTTQDEEPEKTTERMLEHVNPK